ncbi:MAG: PqqD family protein [Desulfocapsaceae bacterium]
MGLFSKKKQQTSLTRDQALACTPVRNDIVDWEILESGLVQLEYVLVLKPFLVSIFERFSSGPAETPTRKLQLDALGSQVWQMIDGSRTTAQLIEDFARHHKISNQEAEQSITLFLRELGKRGLIALG